MKCLCDNFCLQIRKQLEELLSRNGELSRTNTELRHKITEVEYKNKELKDRISGLKSQVDHLSKVKKKHEETIDSLGVSPQVNQFSNFNVFCFSINYLNGFNNFTCRI